ncbi:UNKNOWN [Stylonychia lemnae]|uniref:Uncharacterized protein n=1 Tax=Stylonychia lemnae TaxID=5949 RepID=A0A078A5V5_STYLE|nr:UNKNOWN [Stylonychia lemnae]|eukprot:CDW77574.1 UNKNOWN [Stylonychia lemnae]
MAIQGNTNLKSNPNNFEVRNDKSTSFKDNTRPPPSAVENSENLENIESKINNIADSITGVDFQIKTTLDKKLKIEQELDKGIDDNLAKDIEAQEVKLNEYSNQRNNLIQSKQQLESKNTRIQYGKVVDDGQIVNNKDTYYGSIENMKNQANQIQKVDKEHEEGRRAVQAIQYDNSKKADDLIEQMKKKKQMNQNNPNGASSNQNLSNQNQSQIQMNQQFSSGLGGGLPQNYQLNDPSQNLNPGQNVVHQPMINANGGVPINVNVTVNQNGQQNKLV